MIATRTSGAGDDDPQAQIQSWITTDTYRETVGTVTGLQDDVDPGYTLRRVLEEAITEHCATLEAEYNDGQKWPAVLKFDRKGLNPQTREGGDVTLLQSWITASVRGRAYGTVQGIKDSVDRGYTLRTHLETALRLYRDKQQRDHNRIWPPEDRLRRGRRGTRPKNIPLE